MSYPFAYAKTKKSKTMNANPSLKPRNNPLLNVSPVLPASRQRMVCIQLGGAFPASADPDQRPSSDLI